MQKQKTIGGILVVIALFAQSCTNWVLFSGDKVDAAGPVEENKLVALFVENAIYPTIKNDIERYTTKYIQSRFARTKVLVFPVDTTKIQSTDIQKILSNLYHGGEKETPSTLIGTILVGNVPLPVVKREQYTFPSILPYTDIEKPIYVYDDTVGYYVPTTSQPDQRQELVHGVITFPTTSEYTQYFSKLKSYAANPSLFASQSFWYEDFSKAEQTFTDQNVPLYIQGQLYDEDITYHRYAPVLFSLLQENNNNLSTQIFDNLNIANTTPISDDYPAEFNTAAQAFNSSLSAWSSQLTSIAQQGKQDLQQIGGAQQIPTLVMGQSILQQVKPFESLFSAEYGDFIAKEIETSARWTGVNIGNHITKASIVDQQTSRALLGLNTIFERALDKKIQDESWDLNIPILLTREEAGCEPAKVKSDNFYFGMNARNITGAHQTTWFRGTYGNYLTASTVLTLPRGGTGLLDSTDTLLRGIGASFGFTNQQVIASRGYNTFKAKDDADAYTYRRTHCGNSSKENISYDTYVKNFWGGHTPTNLDGATIQLKTNDRQFAYNPRYNTGIGGALFDLGGSKLTTSPSKTGTNASSVLDYSRLIRVSPGNSSRLGTTNYAWCQPRTPVTGSLFDFYSMAQNPGTRSIVVIGAGATGYTEPATCSERLVYRTINSIIKHTSPTKDEVDKMNITTADRPIDVKRYISFMGLGGQIINLQYPNLYNVEVYKREGNNILLKTIPEIQDSIVAYLQDKTEEYNTLLSGQNSLISGYVASGQAGFTLLATKDPKASPLGRVYTGMSGDFFVSLIGSGPIQQLAQALYVKNSGRPVKSASNNVGDAISNLQSQFSLAGKIYATIENNIVFGEQGIGVNTLGFEAGYIRANGTNTIATKNVPLLIENANNKIQAKKAATNELATNSDRFQAAVDQTCGVSADGTVPLLKWPKALVCWWQNLKKTTLKDAVKVSYKNAQGPVLPLGQFKDTLQESYSDYTTYVNQTLGKDLVENNTIGGISLDIPTTRVLRGAQMPFNALIKNQQNDIIDNALFPIEVTVNNGAEINTPGRASTRVETTSSTESMLLDTRSIPAGVNSITLSAKGPLEPGIDPSKQFSVSQEISIVEGKLAGEINGQVDTFSMVLQNNGYNIVSNGVTSVQDTLLPTLTITLNDTNGQPLSSPVTVSSEKGLLQPGAITTVSEQGTNGTVSKKQFTKQNFWTLQNGRLQIKLLPSMVAGNDAVIIEVPGLLQKKINYRIFPSIPHTVSITDDVKSPTPAVRIAVQDRWGNTIQADTPVQFNVLGDATTNGQRQGTLTVAGSTAMPLTYGPRGGTIYIYGSLAGPETQPGYLRKDIPSRLWPTSGLNIVYLTLEGKGWGAPSDNTASKLISSSPKLLTVTTDLFTRTQSLPALVTIAEDGTIIDNNKVTLADANGRKNILLNNQAIGYIEGNAPYELSDIVIQQARYKVQPTWYKGSTSNRGFAIVEAGGESFEEREPDMAPIRSYAGGMTVGESQKPLFDEARINYGDPFLQHKDAMQIVPSSADTTITLFRDDGKSIKKTMELDIDKDGKKDLVVLYDDDTIRFLKQYGGTPPYRQLGNLMAIADGVHDMWVGDADNNGLEDIFIRTKKNTLRVYKNTAGSFDVHGLPVCIDVPSGNSSLSDVWQIFIADMNNDSLSDIITYDTSGKIRIFYGGSRNGDGFYISTSPTGCDGGRQQRNSTLTVATYGLQLSQNTPVYDDSLVRWQGLTLPDNSEEDMDSNDTIPANIAAALPNPSNPTSINLQQLIASGIPETIRFTASPYDQLPVYESNAELDQIAFIPMKYLEAGDAIEAYKTFAYGQGDEVIVTVTLRARQTTIATYIDQLRGPWEISYTSGSTISGFNGRGLPASSIVNREMDGFEFMIDNIALSAGQTATFSYPVRYRQVQATTIGVEDVNKDGWLDITTSPIDSCTPTRLTYMSNNGTSYAVSSETINTSYTSGLNQLQNNINTQLQNTNTATQNLTNGTGGIGQIPGMDQVFESRQDFLQNGFDPTSMSFNGNFDLNLLYDPKIEKAIDDVVKGLCQGFQAEGGKGLPVPFNVAFLAPGDFNVFGCKVGTDKGLPAFFFPGTLQTPVGPVPIPYGQKGPGDGFYWAPGGVYPSFIRIYAAPTLTLGVGVAVCFGPYGIGFRLPNPFRHIAGNCIVIAKRLGKGKARPYQTPTHPNNPNNTSNLTAGGTSSNNNTTCSNPVQSSTRPSTPFGLTAYQGSRELPIRPAPYNGQPPLNIPQGTYLGLINFDTQPYATQLSQQNAGKIQLKGGKPFKLQIEGGNVKGLIKCVVNKWLDNQLRYVINNLTNMSINVYVPDISQLMEGFKNVRIDEISKVAETFKQDPKAGGSPAGQTLKNLVNTAEGDRGAVSRNDITELGSVVNNPFNALSSWFEQVPLIKVNTRNVTVQVPYIFNDDLTRYTAQLRDYEKQLQTQLKEWERFIADARGLCNREQTAAEKDACNRQIANYADVSTKIGQLQTSIRKNLNTLQAYKRFPLELQQWLTVSQRYITETTDTIQGITNDITSWLNTNATRFEKYVDAIILMIGAVKTWQVLIDFSTSWKSKCGQCTVDNYDYYSCTLGLLCPKLPILPIPPFRLPNIYIDLSQIRLGMDVLLPNIHFVPKTIVLPALPELPIPPTINVDLTVGAGAKITGSPNIPSIPELPAPPILPELPSFIPSIDLNLPILPPAPKVPRLSPSITSTLKVLSLVGKIMCIVKNGIGLVGEKGVKTRIEQMTQRTWNVAPFDSLSITRIQPPLRGFDLRVESYLNFQLNFDVLYDVLNTMTSKINKQTNSIMNAATVGSNAISSVSSSISQGLQNGVNQANINVQGTVDPNSGIKIQGYTEPDMVDPSVLRSDLATELAALKHSEYGDQYDTKIAAVESTINTPLDIKPDTASVIKATNTLKGIFIKKNNELEEHKKDIQEYDSFLKKINTAFLISDNQNIEGEISASLFTTNERVLDTLKNAEHPMTSYLKLQEEIVGGFDNAIKNNTPESLNMGVFTYNKLSNYFSTTKAKVQEAKGYIENSGIPAPSSQNKLSLVANSVADIAQDIVAPSVEAATINAPMTPSNTVGIWWDEHSIYTNQTTILQKKNDGTTFTRFYDFEPISKYSDFADRVDEDGFIARYNTAFNVWNFYSPITSLQVAGQSNTTVNVRWNNDSRRAYLLMLSDTIYANHEHNYSRDIGRKYVIAYDSGFDIQNSFIDIPNIGRKRVNDLLGTTIISTPGFDTTGIDIDVMLSLTGNRWSYTSIVPLIVNTRGSVIEMEPGAPWSAQEALGVQRRGDTTPPVANARVFNKRTQKFVAEGTKITVPRNDPYDLIIEWKDDGAVIENTVMDATNAMQTFPGESATLVNINRTKTLNIIATATDQSDNLATQTLIVSFIDPDIEISAVASKLDQREIGTVLSQTYPNGFVRFYNQRTGNPELLEGTQGGNRTDFATNNDTYLTGRVFFDANTISLFDANNNRIANIDKKTGKIMLTSDIINKVLLNLDFTQNTPSVLMIDKESNNTIFSIYFKAESLQNIISQNGFTSIPVTDTLGTFAGGTCLQDKTNTCVVYITKEGNIYSPDNYKSRIGGTYTYDGGIRYTINIDGTPAATVSFKPTPLE